MPEALSSVRAVLCHLAGAAALVLPLCLSPALSAETDNRGQKLPGEFVFLRDVDPSILQDIRYATTNNFTGRRLAGYEAGECIVKREVALALSRVQQELKVRGLSLKMLDCYRPARASRAMFAWSRELAETTASKRYYPRLHKRDLFSLGYIALYSGHSTGSAVDLTLVDLSVDDQNTFDAAAGYADCTAAADKRAPEGSIDMGTGYDCLDVVAHTRAAAISAEQRKWRQTLVAAMARQGFANYFREWWHFSLPGAGGTAFDFPIPPRTGR
jgi:D-alanyl-D-alanine dipeptidase